MKKALVLSFIILFFCTLSKAQRGKDGAKVVNATESVNDYSNLIFGAGSGNTILNVVSTTLNNNFSGNLAAGDLIMVYQPQGATVLNPFFSPTWGDIFSYQNCGNYEFIQVSNVLSGTQILLECPLVNSYSPSGNSMVIRVPRYSSLTVNAGGILTAAPWNGSTGGILAVEVNGTTTVNAGGTIDVSDIGFRGGQFEFSTLFGGGQYTTNSAFEGAEKGESIAGDQLFYSTNLNGRFCRAAAANGGGGGTAHNAGGAGGANAGDILNWTLGTGVPDPAFNTSWALETPSIVGVTSSGGGRGGYSHAGNNANELTQGPGNAAWGGDTRRQMGGFGGRPLDYSTGKIFMGGGGGAGDGEDNTDGATPGSGGNGGGIIFLTTYGNVNGAGNINANGQNGFDCVGNGNPPFGTVTGKDAAGGAGAGGTILIKTTGSVSSITIDANGGAGGNQIFEIGALANIGEAEGPGGGGGGGYIAITAGTPTRNANGGIYGTTDSPLVSNFNANGATSGGLGMPNEGIDAYDVVVDNDTICPNTTSTLTAIIMGTPPVGAVIEWWDSPNGGTLLFTGNPFTTPSLAITTTYYVSLCPAPFRVPVTVFVNPCTSITADFSSTDSTLCVGDCIDFTDLSTGNTATGWTWSFPGAVTTSSTIQNPTNICYNSPGSFDVELIVTDGTNISTLLIPNFIVVTTLPTVTANASNNPICAGDPLTLTGGGATSYTWDNSVNDGIAFNPSSTTLYTVTGTGANNCQNTDTITVFVNPLPNSGIDGVLAICPTDPSTDLFLQLGGTPDIGGIWSPVMASGTGVFNPAVDPAGTYSYTVTNSCGSSSNDVIVTITASPSPGTNGVATLCANANSINLFDSLTGTPSTGGTWSPVLTSGTGVFDPAFDGAGTYTYSVIDCAGNPQTADVVVSIIALPNTGIDGALAICPTDPSTDLFLQLGGTPDIGGVWSPVLTSGTGVFNPAVDPAGTYTYTVTNSCGSSNNDVIVTITSNPTPGTNGVATLCANANPINLFDSLTGTPSPGGTWSPVLTSGTGVFDPTIDGAGTYTYSVTDCAGNPQTADVIVTINALPTVTANTSNNPICAGDQITLTGGGASSYLWDNGVVDGVAFIPVGTTTYTVTGIDANGCSNTNSIVITVNNCSIPPIANLSASSTSVCINDCIDFTDISTGGAPTNWSWTFFGANPVNANSPNPTNICYDSTGTFDVALVVSNAFGQDSIFIANYITIDSCNSTPISIIIPNVFSPNGDGFNDLFSVSGSGIISVTAKIYNRWGSLLFNSHELINTGWDGRTNSGTESSEGTYFYIIEVVTIDGSDTYKGSLTLIR